VLGHQRLQLPDDRGVAAKGQVGLDPVLHRGQPQLGQPGDLPLGEGLVRHVGKGRAPPQRQPLGQQRRGGVGPAARAAWPSAASRWNLTASTCSGSTASR
jgi:hypothetical protein